MDKAIDGGTTHSNNLIVLDEHEQVVPLSMVEQIVRNVVREEIAAHMERQKIAIEVKPTELHKIFTLTTNRGKPREAQG